MIRCNDTLSLNICSVGLDARIAADVSASKRFPLLQGGRAYIASAAVNVIKGISEHYVVEIDGKTVDGEFTFVCACNGRFYGGGFNPVPEADPTDGLMDVLLVKKVTRLQVPGLIGIYKNGRYRELGDLVDHYRVRSLKMTCDREVPVNVDGEAIFAKEITFSMEDAKLRFFYPRGLSFQAKEQAKV